MIGEESLGTFSWLVINVFLPSFIVSQLLGNFSFQLYSNWWIFPLVSFAVTFSGLAIGQAVLLCYPQMTAKKEFISLVSFQNSGYLPLILVATLFSPEQAQILYVYIFLFLIGFDLVLWSWGVRILTRRTVEKFELKNFIHSPVVAILTSLVVIALGLQKFVPLFIMKPLKMLGDCTLPLAMIVLGGNLAALRAPGFKSREIGLALMAKLVILPLAALAIVLIFRMDFLIGFLVVLEAAVPSAVSLSVIARHYKIEEGLINQALFLGHLACVVTIPVFLMLYTRLRGAF
jgi:predicted permease